MNWQDPETGWTPADVVGTADLNRIEGNTEELHRGNGQTALAPATAAEQLTLPNDTEETFLLVDGSSYIRCISTANRRVGNHIVLIVGGSAPAQLSHNEASAPSGFKKIIIHQAGTNGTFMTRQLSVGQVIVLHLSTDAWHCSF